MKIVEIRKKIHKSNVRHIKSYRNLSNLWSWLSGPLISSVGRKPPSDDDVLLNFVNHHLITSFTLPMCTHASIYIRVLTSLAWSPFTLLFGHCQKKKRGGTIWWQGWYGFGFSLPSLLKNSFGLRNGRRQENTFDNVRQFSYSYQE